MAIPYPLVDNAHVSGKMKSVGFVTAVFQSLFFFSQIRIDPNPHHDGIILASAIASQEGLVSNRDFFTQYGPMTTFLNGLWLELSSVTLLQLRLFNCLLLVITGSILYFLLARKRGPLLGSTVSLLWTFSAPYYILPSASPWPSVLTNLLLLIVLSLIVIRRDPDTDYYSNFLIGLLLTIGVLCRIQLIATLFLIYIYFFFTRDFKSIKQLVSGTTAGFLIMLVYFLTTSSFESWIQDCILWASNRYATPQIFGKAFIVDLSLLLLFPFIYSVWVLIIKGISGINAYILRIASLLLLTFLLFFMNMISVGHKSYLNPSYLLLSGSQNWLGWLGYVSGFALILATFRLISLKFSPDSNFLILLVSSSSLLQLYPAHDAFHLWWITPVLIVGAFYLHIKWVDFYFPSVKLMIFMSLILTLALQLQNLSTARVPFKSEVLNGMYGSPALVQVLDNSAKLLELVPENEAVNFDCVDGLFSVLNGSFTARNLSMVSWGRSNAPLEGSNIKYRFSCYTPPDLEAKYLQNSYVLLGKVRVNGAVTHSLWKLWKQPSAEEFEK